MKYLKPYNESVNKLRDNFYVLTFNHDDLLEVNDMLKKAGYTWYDEESEYDMIDNDEQLVGLAVGNNEPYTISYGSLSSINNIVEYIYTRRGLLRFDYPKQKNELMKFLGLSITPTYEPRKLIRESKLSYEKVVIFGETPYELIRIQEELHKLGFAWLNGSGVRRDWWHDKAYIFANLDNKRITFSQAWNGPDDILLSDVYEKIFKYNELISFLNLIKNGNEITVPSYEPRKLIRESSNYKYDVIVYHFSDLNRLRGTLRKIFGKLNFMNWDPLKRANNEKVMDNVINEIINTYVIPEHYDYMIINFEDDALYFRRHEQLIRDEYLDKCERIYNENELYIIYNILGIQPTYEPKKLIRD